MLGRDLFWYLDRTGLMGKTTGSRIGRRMRARDPVLIGSSPRAIRRHGTVRLRPRATGASGTTVTFADGTELAPSAVIWATGYRLDHSWIDAPVFDERGDLVHERGVTAAPGLVFVGMPWQHTRGSALLGWVEHDAAHLVEHLRALRQARTRRVLA